jgi:hypothetical protein
MYGTCDPGESGCLPPVEVNTSPWEPEPAGFTCRPLEPLLSVPTLVVRGEVSLYSGRQVARILDVVDGDPPTDDSPDYAVALVPQVRELGDARAAQTLPPPDPDVADWIAHVCPQASASSG